jgi:hypothetical protein
MPAASYEFFSDFGDFLMWCPLLGTEQRLNHTVELGEDFRSDARSAGLQACRDRRT